MTKSYEYRVDPEVKLESGRIKWTEITDNSELEEYLNALGAAGWRPVSIEGAGTVFEREKEPEDSAWEVSGRKQIFPLMQMHPAT